MEIIKGNLLAAPTQALVNTVNTVGVMGKGIALQFKENFPNNFKLYERASKEGEVKIGKMFVTRENTLEGEKIIVNFPTKTEWYRKSQYNYIEEGLKDLVQVIKEYKIKSVAIPPLGCGNGGLKWDRVKLLLEQYLSPLQDIRIIIYEPNEAVKGILQKEENKKDKKLTRAGAMVLAALFKYERFGEPASVFAANKLAYFLQESGEDLKLKFVQYDYGPYAQQIDKVLYALNGKYLRGLEQMNAKPFEHLELNYKYFDEVMNYIKMQLNDAQRLRLTNLFRLIDGFESTLSLEILSSTHFILRQDPSIAQDDLLRKVKWTIRKENRIADDYINIAYDHLKEYGRELHVA